MALKIPDAVRRGIRTFAQGFVGVLMLTAISPLNDLVTGMVSGGANDAKIDLTLWHNIALSAMAGGFIALITMVHNGLEDHTNFPAVLKSTPSAGQNPVTTDPPT